MWRKVMKKFGIPKTNKSNEINSVINWKSVRLKALARYRMKWTSIAHTSRSHSAWRWSDHVATLTIPLFHLITCHLTITLRTPRASISNDIETKLDRDDVLCKVVNEREMNWYSIVTVMVGVTNDHEIIFDSSSILMFVTDISKIYQRLTTRPVKRFCMRIYR